MGLDDIKSLLPSHDDLWDKPELVLQDKLKFSELTLMNALELIYIEKRFGRVQQSSLGQRYLSQHS
jgi:hypothetical protein